MASDLILLDSKGINRLLRRCIGLVQTKPSNFFHIKKLKSHGLRVHSKEENIPLSNRIHDDEYVVVDQRGEFVGAIIHELIHVLEPTWTERQVEYAESRIQNRASLYLILKLVKSFVDVIYKRESAKIKKKKPHR